MGLYNNVPTFTYISATGITVTYNQKVYTVQSFYTNKKYIYWDSDNGTVLQASNTMPTRSTKTHLVLINDNGIVTTVPSTSENFEISYDGDSDDAIKSRIYALYQKDKELGDKYVAIEQDVDGIKQLVGTSEGEDGTIIDRVSKIEQRADKLELSVSDIQTTYDDDKELQKVREDLTASIIELNSDLGVFASELQDYYRNNEISSEEAVAIQAGLDQLETSKSNVLNNLDIVKGYIEVSDLSILNNAITEFNNAHIFLAQNVKVAISDSVIIPSEKTIIIDAIAKYNLQINQLKNTCDDIILLGLGGVITEKLSQISMTSNEIKLSVSTVDTKVDNQREEFEKDFSDVNDRLNSLDIVLDGTFENNIIDKTERATLNENITNLKIQKDDVDIEYEKLYNSSYLDGNLKVDYKNVYDDFVSKYNTLLDVINGILDKEDLINDDDRNNVTNAHNNLMSSISAFVIKSNEVIDYISEAQSKEINDKFDKEVNDLNDRVDDVVTDMNGALRDDIIDQAERKVLTDGLNDLEVQKSDVITQYQKIYSDVNLTDITTKQNLKAAYDNFIAKCNNLIGNINSLLNKTELITDDDRNNYQTAYVEYKDSVVLFTEEFYKANSSITDKIITDVRTDFDKEISDLNEVVSDLDETMNGVFKDGILSDAEKIAIREQLSILEREKGDIDTNYEIVYNNTSLSSTTKSSLKAAYTTYNSTYTSLVNTINKILEKTGIISTSEQNSYKNALVNYRGKLVAYSQKLREALDNIADNNIANLRSDLSNEISDVLGSLEDLESEMNASFKDGVLSDAEKTTIKQQVETLKKEKGDVDKQYTSLYSNTSLVDTGTIKTKSELKTAYDNFVSKYNSLISTINTIITKTTNVTSTDRTNLETALSNYRTASATYVTKATNAIDAIALKKAEDASTEVDKKYAEIILGEDGITSRVEAVESKSNTNASNISSLTTRVATAESKITNDAITNVVKQNFYTKDDIDGKGYQNSSEVKQTVDEFRFSFSESGGYNKLYNSAFKNGTSEWSLLNWNSCGGTGGTAGLRTYSAGEEWGLTNRNALAAYVQNITNTSATTNKMGVGFDSHRIWGGTQWTFQCLLAAHRTKSIQIEVVEFDSSGNRLSSQNTYIVTDIRSGGNNRNNWYKFHKAFTLKNSSCAWFIVRVFMNEWTGTSNSAYIWMAEPIVVLGHKSDVIYTPNADEVYSGITTVDKDGIKVQHESGSYTRLNSKEFYQSNENGHRTSSVRFGGFRTYQFPHNGVTAHNYLGSMSSTILSDNSVYGTTLFGSSNNGYISLGFSEENGDSQHKNIKSWLFLNHYSGNGGFPQGVHAIRDFYARSYATFLYTVTLQQTPKLWYGIEFPYQDRTDINSEVSYIKNSANPTAGTRFMNIFGADGINLGVQNGELKVGHKITEEGSAVGLNHSAWGHWNFNWWNLNNAKVTSTLNDPSAELSSKARMFTREAKAKMSTVNILEDRGEDFTMNGQCIVEIPNDIKYNISRYDVRILKYGRGDIWVSERTLDYFVVESENDIKFTWILEGEVLDNKVARKPYDNMDEIEEDGGIAKLSEKDEIEVIPSSKFGLMDDDEINKTLIREAAIKEEMAESNANLEEIL